MGRRPRYSTRRAGRRWGRSTTSATGRSSTRSWISSRLSPSLRPTAGDGGFPKVGELFVQGEAPLSIYATQWILMFPRYGDAHSGCEWVEVIGQGVPAHIGSATPGYGYESGDP